METLEQSRSRSNSSSSLPHYYSGHKYYNISSDEDIYKHNKYGSFTSNRKHYQKKQSKSTSNLRQYQQNPNSPTQFTATSNVPFSQYTPNPYYNVLPADSVSSMHVNFDPNEFYINSRDDISVNSKDSDGEIELDCCDDDGVQVDSISNCSFDSSTISKSKHSTTSSDIRDQIKRDNKESAHHPLLGMTLVTISAIFYAGLNLSVKALMYETPWQELMFIRMFITWLATLLWIFVKYKGKMHLCGPSHQRLLLSIRAFFLWGAMFTCWWSFEFLPVGDGTTLQQSFPVWVSVFAHFVWRNDRGNQRLDLFGWICVLAGLLGIAFVAQPSFIFGVTESNNQKHRDLGICIGICSAMCAGLQYVIVNYTKEDTHWLQVEQMTAGLSVFVFCPLGAVAFALYYYNYNGGHFEFEWESLSTARWMEEIALGLLGFCALALLTRGSQLDAPARTAICLYLQIPFVYIGQCVMTKEVPDVYIFIGIFLVLASVIIPAIRKLRKANKEKRLNQKLKHRRNAMRGSMDKLSDGFDDGELVPLIDNEHTVAMGGISGVTVDWSSEDQSTGNTDIDDEDDYNDIDKAVL